MADKSMNVVIHSAFRRDFRPVEQALEAVCYTMRVRSSSRPRGRTSTLSSLSITRAKPNRRPALKAVGVKDEVIAKMDTEHEQMAQSSPSNAAFDKLGAPGLRRSGWCACRTSRRDIDPLRR